MSSLIYAWSSDRQFTTTVVQVNIDFHSRKITMKGKSSEYKIENNNNIMQTQLRTENNYLEIISANQLSKTIKRQRLS